MFSEWKKDGRIGPHTLVQKGPDRAHLFGSHAQRERLLPECPLRTASLLLRRGCRLLREGDDQ